jgi:hypothetical protein
MTTLLLERTVSSRGERPGSEPCARDEMLDGTRGAHGGFTLDDVIVGAWEDLAVRAVARCPVCSGTMAQTAGAAGGPLEGLCGSCGARFS